MTLKDEFEKAFDRNRPFEIPYEAALWAFKFGLEIAEDLVIKESNSPKGTFNTAVEAIRNLKQDLED